MDQIREVNKSLRKLFIEIKEIKTIVNKIQGNLNEDDLVINLPSENITFPIASEKNLAQFETILKDEAKFSKYVEYFDKELKDLRSATTIYNRRKCLKELLFSE